MAVGNAQKIPNSVAIAHAIDRMTVERHGCRNSLGWCRADIGHETDCGFGAIFTRQIERMLAAAHPDPKTGIAGREMDEDGFRRAADYVLKCGRIHEQLPIVLVGGKIE